MKIDLTKWYTFSIGLMLFLQVLFPKLLPIGIILFVISLIMLGVKKELKVSFSKVYFLLIAFYLSYLIGVFFTHDMKQALHALESKLLFILLPLLFLAIPKVKINFSLLIWLFCSALIIQYFFGIYKGLSCYFEMNYWGCMTSSNFSTIHHPTYLAIYFLMGFVLLIYAKRNKLFGFNGIIPIVFGVVFVLGYLQCLSLSALLFLGILIAIVGFNWFQARIGFKRSLGIVLLLLVTLSTVISFSKDTISDIKDTTKAIRVYIESPMDFVRNGNRELSGNEERLILWTVSVQAIAEQPLGYGSGNIDYVIGKKLKKYGLNELASKNYNSHNQYLQTSIEVGVVGCIILIALFVCLLIKSIQSNNLILLILTSAFAFNSLFESMFQRQSGIVFFVLMVCIFTALILEKEKSLLIANPNLNKDKK